MPYWPLDGEGYSPDVAGVSGDRRMSTSLA